MRVEDATQEDVSALVDLGMTMWEESPHYSKFEIDAEQVRRMISFLIDHESGVVLTCKTDDGEVAGGFVGSVSHFWFSKTAKVMSDDALFIDPKHRGGIAAVKLLRAAFDRAKKKGAVEVQLANATGVFSDQVEKLYEFVGMTRIGGYYYKLLGDEE